MNSVIISLLVVATCCLSAVNGVCCWKLQSIVFSIDDASCNAVGAHGYPDSCYTDICNDGYTARGRYCGKGRCNPFGCQCENGCLSGDFSRSFLSNYKEYNIKILEEEWISGFLFNGEFTGVFKVFGDY